MNKMQNSKVYSMALIALFSAVTAVFSQIIIPIGPVPINLALLAVFTCGCALGRKNGTISIAIYVLLGVVGVPVFTGFQGGLAKVAGPTGGYIIGYLFAVFIIGLMCDKLGRKVWVMAVSIIIGIIVCYAFGTAWFVFSMGEGIWESLMLCVFPFLPGDAAKTVATILIIKALEKTHLLPGTKSVSA